MPDKGRGLKNKTKKQKSCLKLAETIGNFIVSYDNKFRSKGDFRAVWLTQTLLSPFSATYMICFIPRLSYLSHKMAVRSSGVAGFSGISKRRERERLFPRHEIKKKQLSVIRLN